MSDLGPKQARQTGVSISYNLTNRSDPPAFTLSNASIVSITIAGTFLIFLLVAGPVLFRLGKRRRSRRRRTAARSDSGLSFAERGRFAQDEDTNISRRRLKKNMVGEDVLFLETKDSESGGGSGSSSGDSSGGDSRPMARHLSLPVLPPVFSRPQSFSVGGPFPGGGYGNGSVASNRNGDDSGNQTRSEGETCENGERARSSPEKQRGYTIYQNRRESSWIDEDALHGPRVSPRKDTKKKSGWFSGNGLTRTLSRHLSFRRPELDRSPTLPCAQMSQERDFANGPPRKSFEGRKSGCAENTHRPREFEAEVDADLRFPIYQPLQQRERGSLDGPRLVHARTIDPGPQRVSVPGAVPPNPQRRNNPAIDATRQLAGQARVPCVDVGASGQRYSRPRQSNTDAELQAILRRTAERLQDGSRSARRQTLMLPPSAPSGLPGPTRRGLSQEGGFGNDHSRLSGMAPSPARSQKSAPAAMPCPELEGCSPGVRQGPSQNGPPWQTHRRTHTRQISHVSQVSQVSHVSQVSQVSQVSRLSEPDSLVAAPSRTGSQSDVLHTALSSPSRTVNTSPSFVRSYSPVSEQSSALSTVYSEEEDSPPISVLKLDHASKRGYEMDRSAMTQTVRASDAFGSGQMRVDGDAEIGARRRELKTKPHIDHGPHSLHKRKVTLGYVLPNTTQTVATSALTPQDRTRQPAASSLPDATPIHALQTLQGSTDDPFTAFTTPTRCTPQRLSQVFAPLPAELPGDTASSSVQVTEPLSGTPTPSPSHRRVNPISYRSQPITSSLTLGDDHDTQLQVQPPSREGSPVASEGGLSSVYDFYRYSRCSDGPAETSPTKSRWDENTTPTTSTEGRANDRRTERSGGAFRTAHVRLNNVVLGAGAYTQFGGPLGPSTTKNGPVEGRLNVEDSLPLPEPHRDISLGGASHFSAESAYSQDEDEGDTLAPLVPFHSAAATSSKHAMRVTNAVAELRRMNSQVSCVSAHSTATTNITSPTLPALRGGGCSPGKKGATGGAKNYLSLGSSPSREKEGECDNVGNKKPDAGGWRHRNGQNEEKMIPVNTREEETVESRSKAPEGGIAVWNGGVGRPRGNTVVESFEQDLDRARQVFRKSRG